jgi:serine/threonine protein kinase/Tol biopolymer transport system component
MVDEPPHEAALSELPRGAIVDRYVVLRKVGAGGMGIVYAAHDPELDRKIALKLVVAQATETGSRPSGGLRARLLREAQAMAKLSHPNVITVYDAGTAFDQVFIAMEFVEGVTLGRWIKDKPRSVREVLDVFRQAGRGLSAAHAAGLVHRDFKPDNVLIDKGGRARVLDFGLARTALKPDGQPGELPQAHPQPAPAAAPTAAAQEPPPEPVDLGDTLPASSQDHLEWALTMTGAMLGTPLYMAPEQHLSQPADARSDQFSFCVALYEALYGRLPFAGSSLAELRAAVTGGKIQDPPKNARVPAWVRAVLLRGLRVAPGDRYPSMDALLVDLGKDPSLTRRRWFFATGSALALLAAAGLLRQWGRKRGAVTIDHRRITFTGNATFSRFSPDGQRIAYAIGDRLVVRDLASGAETELQTGAIFHNIGWFPDGSEVTFSKLREKGFYAIARGGGSAHLLAAMPASARGELSYDGAEVVYTTSIQKQLVVTARATQAERRIPVTWECNWVEDVVFSPSGRWLLVTTQHQARSTVWSVSVDGTMQQKVVDESIRPTSTRWARREDAFYCLGAGGLYQVAFDPGTGKAAGEPVRILKDSEIASISIGPDGTRIAYTRRKAHSSVWLVQLTRSGTEITATSKRLTKGTLTTGGIALSPDQKTISFSQTEHASNIFTMSLTEGSPKQLTAFQNEQEEIAATAWSPDGSEIAFSQTKSDGSIKLFRIAAGGGAPSPLSHSPVGEDGTIAWSPGQRILYHVAGNQNFMRLDPNTGDEEPLIPEPVGWIFGPSYSPDARQLAVYWNRKPNVGLHVVSVDDGSCRLLRSGQLFAIGWSADGRSIYAAETHSTPTSHEPQKLTIVPVEGGEPTVIPFPFESSVQSVTEAVFVSSMDAVACVVGEAESDIWIAEGFDPDGPNP